MDQPVVNMTLGRLGLSAFRIASITIWVLVVVASFVTSLYTPENGTHARWPLWYQRGIHSNPFALDPIILGIYWIALLLIQLVYTWQLIRGKYDQEPRIVRIGSHFILSNLLLLIIIMLWFWTQFWAAEVILLVNLLNLLYVYRWYPTTLTIRVATITGPLSFASVALFWIGASAIASVVDISKPARIPVPIAALGCFFVGIMCKYRDYTVAFEGAILSAALGTQQFRFQEFGDAQWIIAFVIMAVLSLIASAILLRVFWNGGGVPNQEPGNDPPSDSGPQAQDGHQLDNREPPAYGGALAQPPAYSGALVQPPVYPGPQAQPPPSSGSQAQDDGHQSNDIQPSSSSEPQAQPPPSSGSQAQDDGHQSNDIQPSSSSEPQAQPPPSSGSQAHDDGHQSSDIQPSSEPEAQAQDDGHQSNDIQPSSEPEAQAQDDGHQLDDNHSPSEPEAQAQDGGHQLDDIHSSSETGTQAHDDDDDDMGIDIQPLL